ncbi:hypothetical protein [Endozoicomonas sp.]|uniref:hypothetical protein n=1 Tax=Endozoicomonas sp. TaxID=1892382 RepID=UPI00288810F2|nr:hypothetical protein [Endozoicomonas sp.]
MTGLEGIIPTTVHYDHREFEFSYKPIDHQDPTKGVTITCRTKNGRKVSDWSMELENFTSGLRIGGKRIAMDMPLQVAYGFCRDIYTHTTGCLDGFGGTYLERPIQPICEEISKKYMSALTKK